MKIYAITKMEYFVLHEQGGKRTRVLVVLHNRKKKRERERNEKNIPTVLDEIPFVLILAMKRQKRHQISLICGPIQ